MTMSKNARRLAGRLADMFCKGADPTADEWRALEAAARAGYDAWALNDLLLKWRDEDWEAGVRTWQRGDGSVQRPYLDPAMVAKLRNLQRRGDPALRHRADEARQARSQRRAWVALPEEEQALRVLGGQRPPPKRRRPKRPV